LHVAGRASLRGPRGPLGAAAEKAAPQALPAQEEGRGAPSTAWIALETG
jgi:hypothetical protein